MVESQESELAIKALITERMATLGLSPTQVVRRAGYSNIAKGLRRFGQLCDGQFHGTKGLVQGLPSALEVSPDVVKEAVEKSQRYLREAEEAEWRALFVPHAIILTERTIPQPIFVACFIGVDQFLRIEFDLTTEPASFVQQALKGIKDKLRRWKSDELPAFGKPAGVIVNYSPDQAVQYDLNGEPMAVLDRAHRLGQARLMIGKREFSQAALDAIFVRHE